MSQLFHVCFILSRHDRTIASPKVQTQEYFYSIFWTLNVILQSAVVFTCRFEIMNTDIIFMSCLQCIFMMSRRVSKFIDHEMLALTAPTSSGLDINLALNNKNIIYNCVCHADDVHDDYWVRLSPSCSSNVNKHATMNVATIAF